MWERIQRKRHTLRILYHDLLGSAYQNSLRFQQISERRILRDVARESSVVSRTRNYEPVPFQANIWSNNYRKHTRCYNTSLLSGGCGNPSPSTNVYSLGRSSRSLLATCLTSANVDFSSILTNPMYSPVFSNAIRNVFGDRKFVDLDRSSSHLTNSKIFDFEFE